MLQTPTAKLHEWAQSATDKAWKKWQKGGEGALQPHAGTIPRVPRQGNACHCLGGVLPSGALAPGQSPRRQRLHWQGARLVVLCMRHATRQPALQCLPSMWGGPFTRRGRTAFQELPCWPCRRSQAAARGEVRQQHHHGPRPAWWQRFAAEVAALFFHGAEDARGAARAHPEVDGGSKGRRLCGTCRPPCRHNWMPSRTVRR